MPHSFNYSAILPLISTPRLDSYRALFQPSSDADLYGVYIWAQHAAASLYPLAQNLEISLRNSIDMEARTRFGLYWWKVIRHAGNHQSSLFLDNIRRAERKLSAEWEKKERERLRLKSNAPIPTNRPVWTHDQIIGATDFSSWQFILVNAFAATTPADNQHYLWPRSLGRVFRNYALICNDQNQIRGRLLDLVREIRSYRNRLFHHEPIWIKGPMVIDARTAIDTVRQKINKMELLIKTIDKRKLALLEKVGIPAQARRICSVEELSIYRYRAAEPVLTSRKRRFLRSLASAASQRDVTTSWSCDGVVYGLYRIR